MDFISTFQQIFGQIATIALVIGILTYIIRSAVEKIGSRVKQNKVWVEIVLPSIPFLIGFIFGYFHVYKLSWELGVIAGFASSYLFRVFKSYLVVAEKKLEKDEEEAVKEADSTKPVDPKV